MSVFTAVRNSDGETRVFPARGYQEQAYLAFMLNQDTVKENFSYPGYITFTLKKFDMHGLKGDYQSFCVLENDKGEEHIMSNDKILLEGFVGWKNRLTMC